MASYVSNMVCREFGYASAVVSANNRPYGPGSGKIWLDVRCRGNETSILECPRHGGLGETYFTYSQHQDDISVSCLGEYIQVILVLGGTLRSVSKN
jgi:hypothetical protein